MCGGIERCHVRAGLGDDHVGDEDGDARGRHEDVPGGAKGRDRLLDACGELVDQRVMLLDLGQVLAHHERVMLGEPADQCVLQLRDLVSHHALRKVREHDRIALPIGEGTEHQPARYSGEVGDHPGQFDSAGLEELLQPLFDASPVPGGEGARPGQIPQLPDRFRRHQRAAQQPMRGQLRQPRRIRHIGLASRDVAGLLRVDQHHRQLVFHDVVERLPVVAGRFHHDRGDPLAGQVVDQVQDLRHRRTPRRHRRLERTGTSTRNPHRDLRVTLGDIDPRRAFMHDIHDLAFLPCR